MANTPPVYSEHDRHQLLLKIASMVKQQVEETPNAHHYYEPEYEAVPVPSAHTSSK